MQESIMSCPICDKNANIKYRPFCSKHCADVDLGRWFNGAYTVPADTPEDMDEAATEMEKSNLATH